MLQTSIFLLRGACVLARLRAALSHTSTRGVQRLPDPHLTMLHSDVMKCIMNRPVHTCTGARCLLSSEPESLYSLTGVELGLKNLKQGCIHTAA